MAEILLGQIAPSELVLSTRTPEALEDLAARGAVVRHGDYSRPETLAAAFAGGKTLLLVSATNLEQRVVQHRAAVDAAVAAGIERIVYTSGLRPEPANPAVVAASHHATEQAVIESGVAWTFLRNSLYADFQVADAVRCLAAGTFVHNRGDGRVAYASREDCAAAAAAVLSTSGHEQAAYDITGPGAFSAAELASLYTELGRRPIEVVDLDDETFKAGIIGDVTGDDHLVYGAGLVTSFGRSIREGYQSACTNAVAELTGREPRALRDVLEARREELLAAASAG